MIEQRTLGADVADLVDVDALHNEVKEKYREVAANPTGTYHFHTGRAHALRMGYPEWPLAQLPDEATEAFAGVGNPFYWGLPAPGSTVLDLGSGGGMDSFIAALAVGAGGRVIGVDMTDEMVSRAGATAESLGLGNVEFRAGYIEDAPVESATVDVVISNGVFNLCPNKARVYEEVARVLKPGGQMTIADICVERPVPEGALKDIDLWTG
ncbi:MAG: methyltransferase domain-containing protein [Actinomycetota bacterium]|nr:methyltransferase domain-containing protein [Actinomycetota bacterium]